jgi:outer membrane protein OmpA-like peptidoglycan-associated protein
MKRLILICSIFALSFQVQSASARDGAPDIQQFKPVTDMQGFLLVQDATLMPQFRPGVAMTFNYALNPFEVQLQGYGRQFGITDGIVGGDLTAAFGIFDWWEIGMRFPFMQIPIETSFIETFGGKAVDYGIGDITFATRFRALDPETYKIGFAPGLFLTLPTGNEKAALGRGKPGGGVRLAISQRWDRFHFAVNLGYAFYPRATVANLTTGDELFYAVGVGVSPIVDKLDVRVELDGSLTPGPNDDGAERFGDLTHSPLEVAASVQYKFDNGFAVHGGLGTGITTGFGSPALRVFAGASWAKFGPRDRDKDGIVDPDDACMKEPEDLDGFEDGDGCPDLDNDGDGFPDLQDKCPDEAEDKDGYFDGDGCIDPDNDGDGLLDGADACVDEAEDMDGFQDEDGCPDLDNDGDGIEDSADSCPDAAETVDGWKDEDGCPDPDNDGDTFLDVDDLCPNRAEEMNGDRDEDGCPDDVLVVRKGDTIHLLEKVAFKKKSRLAKSSKEVLLALAEVLTNNPGIVKVRVEGHTSSKGKDKSNLRTSSKEAKAVVKRLIKYGVDPTRLEAVGYGETRPIRSNRTRSGRAANRRIEVKVTSDAGAELPEASPEAAPQEAPAGPVDAADPWGTAGPKPAVLPALENSSSPWGEAEKKDDSDKE